MILSFRSVVHHIGTGRALRGLGLELAGGACIAMTGPAAVRAALADLALGLRDPVAGTVEFEGASWAAMSPRAKVAARSAIGSALDRPSWLSNLDVDENLTLAERMHGGGTTAEVRVLAADIAERLGLGAIPNCRPHDLDSDLRVGLTFVRALLGTRRLLVLEDPGDRLAVRVRDALAAELAERRRGGCAVLWLGAHDAPGSLGAAVGPSIITEEFA